jgi:hypothetical protein
MRLLSWAVTFIISMIIALALVLTFTQQEFKTTVGAQILTYKTQQLPVYYYVAGAFAAGLLFGVLQAIFTFFRTKAQVFHKNGKIRELERTISELEQRITAFEANAKLREKTPEFPIAPNSGTPA